MLSPAPSPTTALVAGLYPIAGWRNIAPANGVLRAIRREAATARRGCLGDGAAADRVEPGRADRVEPGRADRVEPGRADRVEPGRADRVEPGRADRDRCYARAATRILRTARRTASRAAGGSSTAASPASLSTSRTSQSSPA